MFSQALATESPNFMIKKDLDISVFTTTKLFQYFWKLRI